MKLRSAVAFFILVLLSAACNGGGGDGVAQLNANVDLSGVWSMRLTVTSAAGDTEGLRAGSVIPGVTQLLHDRALGQLTVDANDPNEASTETLDGATVSRDETVPLGNGDVETATLNLTFSADGTSVTGSGRIRVVDASGNVLSDIVFKLAGEPVGGSLMFLLDWAGENDIDLEATEPDGTLLYYGFAQGGSSSGRHSGDANHDCTDNMIGAEAITYTNPQPGHYTANVYVSFFTICNTEDAVEFTLTCVEPGASTPTVVHDWVSRNGEFTQQVTVP